MSTNVDCHSSPVKTAFRLLTDEERQTSLHRAMAHWDKRQDIWVFGYGSLVWRPEFDFLEQRLAQLHGYHRALCLWSRVNRGTPEQPGLVFGLEAGGSCRGMAYKVAASAAHATLEALWRREMASGVYTPKWLNCRTAQGNINALIFTMNNKTHGYVGDLTKEKLITIVQSAHGRYGPCTEYVLETAHALRSAGIHDTKLEAIVRQLRDVAPNLPLNKNE
jgi:cation transport protein ChaC